MAATVLITGAAAGIGRVTALCLASQGWHCVLVDADEAGLRRLQADWPTDASAPLGLVADLTDVTQIRHLANEVPSLDALINNAGRAWVAPVEDMPLDRWQQVLDLNITAPFLCAQAFGREMIKVKRGKIINIASIAGLVGRNPKNYNSIAYGTSKGALVNFTRDLAVKWAQHNIQVNAICPGFFVTPINVKMFDKVSEQIVGEIPLGRTGGDDDLKGLIVVLASDASNFMTGTVIPVDGGTTAW